MNNVVDLDLKRAEDKVVTHLNRPEAFNDKSDLYFNVWERPAYFIGKAREGLDGKNISTYFKDHNHKHIVRMYNGEPVSLGIVGRNYKLLKNKELCEGIEETFTDTLTNEELRDVRRTDRTSHMGATSLRDYIFPNIKTDIGSTRSDIAFRTIVVNGYDGSSSFKFYHGAIDFFCENGMVAGIFDMTVKRHTKGLTIPNLTKRLRRSIDIFYKQAEQWKHWVGKTISDEDAEECYKAMPNISERRVAQLMHQFRIECDSHGRTVWALYSAATFYATRNEGNFAVRNTDTDHVATTVMNRERQVRAWVSTQEFEEIAA